MKYIMFIKVHIQSRYSLGFYKFSTKNQKIINKLLKRTPMGNYFIDGKYIDNEFIVNRIVHKYLNNKFKETYVDFSVRWEKFRIIKANKFKRYKRK